MTNQGEHFTRLQRIVLCTAVAAFAYLWAWVSVQSYWSVGQAEQFDAVFYFQRVWQTAFLDATDRTMMDSEVGSSLLEGRHFVPTLGILVPLQYVVPGIAGANGFRGVLYALAALPVAGIGLRLTHDAWGGVLLAAAWLASPLIWAVQVQALQPLTLSAPFIAVTIWAVVARRPVLVVLSALLAAGCREEIPWLLLAFVPALTVLHRRDARGLVGVVSLAAAALAWVLISRIHLGGWSTFMDFGDIPTGTGKLLFGREGGQLASMIGQQQGFWGLPVAVALASPLLALPWAAWSVALLTTPVGPTSGARSTACRSRPLLCRASRWPAIGWRILPLRSSDAWLRARWIGNDGG